MSAAVNSSSHADTDERHFESHKKRGRQENQIKIHRQNWKRRKKGEQVRRRTHASHVSQWPLSSNREVGLVSCKSTCIYIGLSGAKRCVQFSSRHSILCIYCASNVAADGWRPGPNVRRQNGHVWRARQRVTIYCRPIGNESYLRSPELDSCEPPYSL